MYGVLPGIIFDNICVFIGLCFIIFSFGIEKLIGCNDILLYYNIIKIIKMTHTTGKYTYGKSNIFWNNS